jgi:hypothetical protein
VYCFWIDDWNPCHEAFVTELIAVRVQVDLLADDFGSMLSNKKYSDVSFLVGPNKTVFEAHRLMLAARSRVFEAMLFSKFQEGISRTVEIPDVVTRENGPFL